MNATTWWKLDAVGASVLVGLSLAGWMLAVKPYQLAITQKQSLAAQLETELSQAANLRANAASAQRTAEEFEARQRASVIQLHPATQFNARLATLTELAAHHALRVDAMTPGELVMRDHRGDIPIRVEGRGPFPNVAAFLAALHEAHRDTAVRSIDLRADPNAGTPAYTLELIWAVAQPPKS